MIFTHTLPQNMPRNNKRLLIAVGVGIFGGPTMALADVGTPLMWGGMFHLCIGNAIIGLFEGWLLARVFGLSQRRCASLLVLANYISAWTGIILASSIFYRYAVDIYSGLRVTWLLVAVTYLLTLLIEWPFVAVCFRGMRSWLTGSIKGSLMIQSASYLILFGLYWPLSGTSLYTQMEVVLPEQILAPRGVVMYYISNADGNVYRSELGNAPDIKVAELDATKSMDYHLGLQDCPTNTQYWDLTAVIERNDTTVIVPQFSTKYLIPEEQAWRTGQYFGWSMGSFQVGVATNSHWRFNWAHWPDLGMWGYDGLRKIQIAFGTPFGGWAPYRVIHLPEDKILLQLNHQICLADIPNRKIALIRNGFGMLAFMTNQIRESNGSIKLNPPKKLE
jgi:hypothetical protein